MPTFTTVALENLIHHALPKKPLPDAGNGAPKHLYIMPALYSTPAQAPLPENAAAHSPSPYVVNHKGRGWGNEATALLEASRNGDGSNFDEHEKKAAEEEEEVGDNFFKDGDDSCDKDECFFNSAALELASENESDAAATAIAIEEAPDGNFVSAPGEFFDAIDEFASDGSTSTADSSDNRIELELHSSRLHDEIERRKSAEESLALMRKHWEMMRSLMSELGLTFPNSSDGMQQLKDDFAAQISQEIIVARFVAESVGRGEGRAEAEQVAAAIIESKDQEILRLRDRLQYYETVNHELSQRNLVEVARRQQERRRRWRRKWVWGLIGLSISAGVSMAAYTYSPQVTQRPSILDSDNSDL